MHIPKTAGTSLRVIMENNIGIESIFPNSTFLEEYGGYPPLSKLEIYSQDIYKADFFLGHYPYWWMIKKFPHFEMITFLRDPVKRTVSHLRHLKIHNKECANLKLDEILKMPKLKKQFDNLQTRYFLSSNVHGDLNDSHLKQALQNAGKFGFIGYSDTFDYDVKKLASTLKFSVKSKVKSNVYEQKGESFKGAEFEPSDEILEKIREMNKMDTRLIESLSKSL